MQPVLDPLLDSLQRCGEQVFHLEKQGKRWKAVLGRPREDQSKLIEELAKAVWDCAQEQTMTLLQADELTFRIEKVCMQPQGFGITRLFQAAIPTVKAHHTAAFTHLKNAVNRHIQMKSCHFPEVKNTLFYLLEKNDLHRFARVYRSIYYPEIAMEAQRDKERLQALSETREQIERTLETVIAALLLNFPNSLWLRRAQDPEWICKLVPLPDLACVPKDLDFRGCEATAIDQVIYAHQGRDYTQLNLRLSCSQEEFVWLADKGCFHLAHDLDLKECTGLHWEKIQSILASLKGLKAITFPTTLVVEESTLSWSPAWQGELKDSVKLALARVRDGGQKRTRLTFINHLARNAEEASLSPASSLRVSTLLRTFKEIERLEEFWKMSQSLEIPPTQVLDIFGADPQGLSDEAAKTIFTLQHTGLPPPMSLSVAMELISSDNTILEDSHAREKFKEYCRVILLTRLEQTHMLDLYAFAQSSKDATLLFIGRTFIDTFFPYEIPELWNLLNDDEKKIIQAIRKDPALPGPLPYFDGTPFGTLNFSKDAAPLHVQVRNDDLARFALRYAHSDPVKRQDYVQTILLARFPECKWLKKATPTWILQFVPRDEDPHKPQELDLRGCELAILILALQALSKFRKWAVTLDCCQKDFIELADIQAFDRVCSLNLRYCTGMNWEILEPYLLKMNLTQLALPLDLGKD